MRKTALAITILFAALSPAAGPRVARGETPGSATDTPRIDSVPVPGSSIERVRGTVAINAPIQRLRAIVFDFPRYPEFMSLYRKGSIERRNPSGSVEARLDIEEMAGAVQRWVKFEVSAAAHAGAVESYDGRFLAGNVKAFQSHWELEALSPTRTRLTVESFMDPDLRIVPAALINSGSRDRVRDILLAFKARAEGSK